MSLPSPRPVVAPVIDQHLEVAMHLHGTRQILLDAPHVRLHQLARLDERLIAHLDGLALAGEAGLRASDTTLVAPFGGGALFVAAALALQAGDGARLERLLGLVEAVPDAAPALASAFGWVSSHHLRGVTKGLLDASSPLRRAIGLQACAAHQVDPGLALTAAGGDPDPYLQATAWRAAGELGRTDLLPAAIRALARPDDAVRFEAARAAVRLGDRSAAPATLRAFTVHAGPCRADALASALLVMSPGEVHGLLKSLPADPVGERLRIRGAGWSGDPVYVPWLIKQTTTPALARVAGEALSFITGLNLADSDLDGPALHDTPPGATDDPDDEDVALDEDENLPWPDHDRLSAWWQAHGAQFPPGTRHVVGHMPSPAHLATVLADGVQRHRVLAADLLPLLTPGARRFNTAAPAHRQQRLLQVASRP